MRKLLVTCLIISLAAAAASAQITPRNTNKTGSTKTGLVPAAATDQRNSKTSTAQKKERTNGNAKAKQQSQPENNNAGTAQNRNSQSGDNNTPSTTSRPSLTNQNGGTAARNVGTTPKKAPEVKAVNPVKVKWMTLEEALEKSKTDKRKIFVDVFTDWCGWCKRMDSTTFMNPVVAQYLNDHYYPVKFNAEQQKEIVFKDKTYQFKKNGARGYHELAAEWLNNRLSYPTVVFLDESHGTIQPLSGYQDAAKMEAMLNYFGTDSHKKTPWETYQKNFKQGKDK